MMQIPTSFLPLPYLLIAVFAALCVVDVRKAILFGMVARPVIDCFYETNFGVAGIKPTEIFGTLFPLLVAARLLFSREHAFTRAPLAPLWFVYLFFQLFGTVLIATVGDDAKLAVNHFFRLFHGFIGWYLFQEFFAERESFRRLLVALLVAGLFPLGMSVYQNLLGGTLRTETTIGGLLRNIGLYHDAYTMRLYAMQTLAAAGLYRHYFVDRFRIPTRASLAALAGLSAFTVYRIYSKAGYVALAAWLLILAIGRRKAALLLPIAVIAGFLFLGEGGKPLQRIETVYSTEIGAVEGRQKTDRLFAGRVGGWKVQFRGFSEQSTWLQLVGDGSPHTGAHNDFLRALFGTGTIGLALYVTLLGAVGWRVVRNALRANTALNLVAVMLVAMWVVDAIGLVPGAYTGYQLFVWGFIGLALRGVDGLERPPERSPA